MLLNFSGYWFSPENLITDKLHICEHMDSQGFILLTFIAGLGGNKAPSLDVNALRSVCMESTIVEYVSDLDGVEKVRCREDWEMWLLPKEHRHPSARSDSPREVLGSLKTPPSEIEDGGEVPIGLNSSTSLKSGAEMGFLTGSMEAVEKYGVKIYQGILKVSLDCSVAFPVRNMSSGEICGLVLRLKTCRTFDVSIVYGLGETEFKEGFAFEHLLGGDSRDLARDTIFYKLEEGGHLFLTCDNPEALSRRGLGTRARLRVGIVYLP
jgi:hypothetical protein